MLLKQTAKMPQAIVEGVLCDAGGFRNWQWLVYSDGRTLLVDPAYRADIEHRLSARSIDSVDAIVVTHDDHDHVAAVDYFANNYSAEVLYLRSSGSLEITGYTLQSIFTPGHRIQHYSFSVELGDELYFFAGDLLFVGGCGRVFTGDYAAMAESLARVQNEVDGRAILCAGHDYSQSNFAFIEQLGIDSAAFQGIRASYPRFAAGDCHQPRQSLADEASYNPFLRLTSAEVLTALQQKYSRTPANAAQALQMLRQFKESL